MPACQIFSGYIAEEIIFFYPEQFTIAYFVFLLPLLTYGNKTADTWPIAALMPKYTLFPANLVGNAFPCLGEEQFFQSLEFYFDQITVTKPVEEGKEFTVEETTVTTK